jgi:hypothetical protein
MAKKVINSNEEAAAAGVSWRQPKIRENNNRQWRKWRNMKYISQ